MTHLMSWGARWGVQVGQRAMLICFFRLVLCYDFPSWTSQVKVNKKVFTTLTFHKSFFEVDFKGKKTDYTLLELLLTFNNV